MRKLFWIVLALLVVGGALIPRAKADTFVYEVTSNDNNLHVIFELPTFQEHVDTTTFTLADDVFGTVIEFVLSGNSTGCRIGSNGPCYAVADSGGGGFQNLVSPSFTAPGTFTATDGVITTTVTITDVPTATPEPSSLALLPLGLGALLLLTRKLRQDVAM